MSKDNKKDQPTNLLEMAKAAANQVLSSSRGGGSRTTYLSRMVANMLDADGKPTVQITRNDLSAKIALEMCQERAQSDIAADKRKDEFSLSGGPESEDFKAFVTQVQKVKKQVAAGIADNNNSTSLSYNDAYKNVWKVLKLDGGLLQLEAIPAKE